MREATAGFRYLERAEPREQARERLAALPPLSDERNELVERFLPLARRLARRYQRPDEPLDDLVQVAAVGLVKAASRFEPERGVAFSTYAVPTILGELKRHFRDRTWSMRVPRDLKDLALRIDRTVDELTRRLQRSPSIPELAAAVEASEERVLDALEAFSAHRAVSLDAPRGLEGEDPASTLADVIGDDDAGFGLVDNRVAIDRLLTVLAPREREILRLRFVEDLTQAEIGERVGVSQMQVSRLLRQSLAMLREAAGDDA